MSTGSSPLVQEVCPPEVGAAAGEVLRGVGEVLVRGPVAHRGQHAAGRLDHVAAGLRTHTLPFKADYVFFSILRKYSQVEKL